MIVDDGFVSYYTVSCAFPFDDERVVCLDPFGDEAVFVQLTFIIPWYTSNY